MQWLLAEKKAKHCHRIFKGTTNPPALVEVLVGTGDISKIATTLVLLYIWRNITIILVANTKVYFAYRASP